MVGVPTSNRCMLCTKRKIKCDETWPTCGSCSKAKKECSGPFRKNKFVNNGEHKVMPLEDRKYGMRIAAVDDPEEPPSGDPSAGVTTPASNFIEQTIKFAKQGGGTFRRLRIANRASISPTAAIASRLRAPPQSPDDTTVARLVSHINATAGTGYDLRRSGLEDVMQTMPRRWSLSSPALKSAFELLFSSWCNLRQGLQPKDVLDLRARAKALRSLNQALQDPKERLSLDTYAAASIFCKAELLFDYNKGVNRDNHALGVASLMETRGARVDYDDLETALFPSNVGILTMHFIKEGRDFFLARPEWSNVIKPILTHCDDGRLPTPKLAVRICFQVVQWPSIVRLLRKIQSKPDDLETLSIATDIVQRVSNILEELRGIDRDIFQPMRDRQDIRLEEQPGSMFKQGYNFSDWRNSMPFLFHALFFIAMCRMLAAAYAFVGIADPNLELEILEHSSRVWLSYHYEAQLLPLGAGDMVAPLVMSYEAGNEAERAFVLESLRQLDSRRGQGAAGDHELFVGVNVLALGRAMTGRMPFLRTQDAGVEIRGEGARS